MRKAILLTFLSIAVALPSLADDRHQSYISYDDGGTVVRSGDDGRDIDAHRNLPIYPGDEVITARRGRAEIRLSDGNIVGIDRATAVRFRSILDSYEGEDEATIAELRYGKVAIYRTDLGRDRVRLDTTSASYVAPYEAIYSVETDSRGRDHVTVFSGSVEVRTPSRSTRIRAGEAATVDDRGLYDLIGDRRASADDFERWFLDRSGRFDRRGSSHVDRRLSYWADDLDDYGRWVNVSGVGWSWRPYVSVGWRPYYNGYWHYGRGGCLTWVSYDPWAWGTYHYGRWAHDPHFGWVWVPGYSYSPAWVYWWYGSGYVGWAPAGWWDCYRPYYSWAYQPYRHRDFGFGFYGRVRVSELDLTPWTFIDSRTIVSTRVDRAALTTDAIKHRLGRSSGGYATISGAPARFTREELPDPAGAIRRRGLDGQWTGRETGAPPTDLTPFFRRDENLGGTIRDRIVSARGGSPSTISGGASAPSRNVGGATPGNRDAGGRIGRGSLVPGDGQRGSVPSTGGIDRRGEIGGIDRRDGEAGGIDRRGGEAGSIDRRGGTGGINRGSSGGTGDSRDPVRTIGREPAAPRDSGRGEVDRGSSGWRDRIIDRGSTAPRATEPPASSGAPSVSEPRESQRPTDSWRGRSRAVAPPSTSPSPASSDRGSSASRGSSDVPRRVIDRIGGARVYPSDRGRSRSTEGAERGGSSRQSVRPSSPPRSSSPPPSTRSSSPSRDSGSSSRGSSSRGSSRGSSSGGNRESGGKIKRDQ